MLFLCNKAVAIITYTGNFCYRLKLIVIPLGET